MATIKVKRSDRFPIGTTVKLYPAGGRQFGSPPSGTAAAEATVEADGSLEWTGAGVEEAVPYVAYAESGGVGRYLNVQASAFVEPGTLAERIAARRAAVGAV